MINDKDPRIKIEDFVVPLVNTAIKVITDPSAFFKNMAKNGGFLEPLIFMVAMGFCSGVLQAVLAIFGLAKDVPLSMALASIIIAPVFMAVFGFIVAFVLFIIWKIMGSREPFETAFRCNAYISSITPINTVLNVIPYIGPVLGFIWMMYLLIIASIEVHSIRPKVAWIVFGLICAFLSIASINSQIALKEQEIETRRLMDRYEKELPDTRSEETKQKTQEFLKRFEDASENK